MVRPKLPESERKTEVLQIRLTKAERRFLDKGAKRAGLSITEFIRLHALAAAALSPKGI